MAEIITGYEKMALLSQRFLENELNEIKQRWRGTYRAGVTTASEAARYLQCSPYKFAKLRKRYHLKALYGDRFALYRWYDVHRVAQRIEEAAAYDKHKTRMAKYKRDFKR